MSFSEIENLFDSGGLPTVTSDSRYVVDSFASLGFPTVTVREVCDGLHDAPLETILVPARPAKHPNSELHEALKHSAVLLIPLLAFAPDKRSVDYLISRLPSLDFSAACDRSRVVVESVQHVRVPIAVTSPGCALSVELGENVSVFAPKLEPRIARGEWISVIQFLEVALLPSDAHPSFNVNGTLLCSGVSIAHHLHSHFESGQVADDAWTFFSQLRSSGHFPLVLEVKDSGMMGIVTRKGDDVLEEVKSFTDEIMRGRLTEVGFGSLEASSETDWSVNSQLNEPAGGIHLALGTGEKAAHIDFVSPDATIVAKLA